MPDYELQDTLVLTTPAQLKALGNPLRQKILGLLLERAASASQLAIAMEHSKGAVGHHLKVLEQAGLIRVVRTRRVRALTERYYGCVARTFDVLATEAEHADDTLLLRQAMQELTPSPSAHKLPVITLCHARMTPTQARDFAHEVLKLAQKFESLSAPGEQVYGFIAGVYRTDWPQIDESLNDDSWGGNSVS